MHTVPIFIPDFYQITVQIADSYDQERPQSSILPSAVFTRSQTDTDIYKKQHGFGCYNYLVTSLILQSRVSQ